jgi:drug/metabolite transporter (DMT)-like permease
MLANTFHPVSGYDLAMLIGMGATATLAQLAMTRAYREGDTLTVGSFAYSTVVFASLLGYLLWNETLPAESWGGVAVIVLSGVISVRFTPRG